MAVRRAFAMSCALALVAASAMSVRLHAQDDVFGSMPMPSDNKPAPTKPGPPNGIKLNKDELAQYEKIRTTMDAVAAGKQPAPADAKLTLHSHFLRAGDDVYVPYMLEVEPDKLTSFPLAMYVRVVAKNPVAAAAPAGKAAKGGKGGKLTPTAGSAYAFEDVAFVTPGADHTIQRALALAPGDYDVYISLAEKPSKDKKAPAAKSVVSNLKLTVPDLLSGFTTSTIILARSLDRADKQPVGQDQLAQPFTISGYKIAPTLSSSFAKSSELLWVFYIHNEGAGANGKPDLNVEYNFFRAAEDKPFSKLPDAEQNASNLPSEFSLAAGHQVLIGQGVPLETFAAGDYKLEIKITDKTNSQSITRSVPFSVTP